MRVLFPISSNPFSPSPTVTIPANTPSGNNPEYTLTVTDGNCTDMATIFVDVSGGGTVYYYRKFGLMCEGTFTILDSQ